jgi:hypothetical protein
LYDPEGPYKLDTLWWRYYVQMYENGKMRPIEIIPGMGEMKENGGGSEFKYDIL